MQSHRKDRALDSISPAPGRKLFQFVAIEILYWTLYCCARYMYTSHFFVLLDKLWEKSISCIVSGAEYIQEHLCARQKDKNFIIAVHIRERSCCNIPAKWIYKRRGAFIVSELNSTKTLLLLPDMTLVFLHSRCVVDFAFASIAVKREEATQSQCHLTLLALPRSFEPACCSGARRAIIRGEPRVCAALARNALLQTDELTMLCIIKSAGKSSHWSLQWLNRRGGSRKIKRNCWCHFSC